jgi:hypothetical protein
MHIIPKKNKNESALAADLYVFLPNKERSSDDL